MLRFVRAFLAATDWVLRAEHREETLDLMQEYQKIPRMLAEIKLGQMIPKAALDPADINRVLQLRMEMGLYDPPYDPIERFYDASIWSEVTGLPPPPAFGMPRPI